jgi:outer membrane receptor protein involved in Fe transport
MKHGLASQLMILGTAIFCLLQPPLGAQSADTTGSSTLPAVTVTAKPVVETAGPNWRKYDLFLMRRKLGMGTFLTRDQIEAKPAAQTFQLFQNIPGLKISQHGTQWIIRSQRCPAKLPMAGGPPPDMDGDNPEYPILFIDGFRVRGLNTLNTLKPNEIEAIEVYQGAAQLPAEAKGNACAAIFVWLRQKR